MNLFFLEVDGEKVALDGPQCADSVLSLEAANVDEHPLPEQSGYLIVKGHGARLQECSCTQSTATRVAGEVVCYLPATSVA